MKIILARTDHFVTALFGLIKMSNIDELKTGVKVQVQFKFLVITDKVQEKKTSDFLTLYYHLSYITNDNTINHKI